MTTPTSDRTPAQLRQALKSLVREFNGGGGNCALVACVLDEVLETGGDFVVVSGEHYEFADHVFVRWEGLLWDMSGSATPEDAESAWCDVEEGDDAPELEDFPDPTQATIERMADPNSILAGGFDRRAFHVALVERLSALGWKDLALPETPATAERNVEQHTAATGTVQADDTGPTAPRAPRRAAP